METRLDHVETSTCLSKRGFKTIIDDVTKVSKRLVTMFHLHGVHFWSREHYVIKQVWLPLECLGQYAMIEVPFPNIGLSWSTYSNKMDYFLETLSGDVYHLKRSYESIFRTKKLLRGNAITELGFICTYIYATKRT